MAERRGADSVPDVGSPVAQLGRELAAAVSVTLLGSRADVRRLSELGEYLRTVVAEWSTVPVH